MTFSKTKLKKVVGTILIVIGLALGGAVVTSCGSAWKTTVSTKRVTDKNVKDTTVINYSTYKFPPTL